MTASREMPKYQCHKQVWALKIKTVAAHASGDTAVSDAEFQASDAFQGGHLITVEDGYAPFHVSADWFRKHKPEEGGYYVVYEDGYKSYSPASAFESGYSLIPPASTHREELERELVHGASSQIAHAPENAAAIAKGIKTVLDELAPVAPHPVAIAPLPALDHGTDSLERAMESKTYQDGTTAFGPAPLPDVSPALWAKPLAKEVPELTVSLSDLGLEREIQANSHHSGCKGERRMASAANGYAHSRECIDEAGEAQGWTPTAEDYAKCGPSAGCCGAAPTDSHASAVLYPAIERAMSELGTLHPAFNFAVNRAFNHLHDAFWSECPAPASAAPKRPNFPGV